MSRPQITLPPIIADFCFGSGPPQLRMLPGLKVRGQRRKFWAGKGTKLLQEERGTGSVVVEQAISTTVRQSSTNTGSQRVVGVTVWVNTPVAKYRIVIQESLQKPGKSQDRQRTRQGQRQAKINTEYQTKNRLRTQN